MRLTILLVLLLTSIACLLAANAPPYDAVAECQERGGKAIDWDCRIVCMGPVGEVVAK